MKFLVQLFAQPRRTRQRDESVADQLREHNEVLADIRIRREQDAEELFTYWCEYVGVTTIPKADWTWLVRQLEFYPSEVIRQGMLVAISRGAVRGGGCFWPRRGWRDGFSADLGRSPTCGDPRFAVSLCCG